MDLPRTQTPGYRPQAPDTDDWAERLLCAHWRAMKPHEKVELPTQLCRSTHRLSLAGLAHRHPVRIPRSWSFRAACLRIGQEAVEKVLGHPLSFAQ